MPDRQLQLLTIQALAAAHDWPALQHLAGRLDRKSAGLTQEHFIAAARAQGAPAEVQRFFVDRLTGEGAALRKAQLFSELGMPAAAQQALQQAEAAAGGGTAAGMLGSLRGAVGDTVGSLVSRMQQQGVLR